MRATATGLARGFLDGVEFCASSNDWQGFPMFRAFTSTARGSARWWSIRIALSDGGAAHLDTVTSTANRLALDRAGELEVRQQSAAALEFVPRLDFSRRWRGAAGSTPFGAGVVEADAGLVEMDAGARGPRAHDVGCACGDASAHVTLLTLAMLVLVGSAAPLTRCEGAEAAHRGSSWPLHAQSSR